MFGIQLNTTQLQMMHAVWATFSQIARLDDAEPHRYQFSLAATEHLCQLLVMFWNETSRDGQMEHNAIVHFSGVLGIHPTELSFRRAYDYTPYLSALMWLGRLILLEFALPLEAYNTLPTVWPSRSAYADQLRRLRDEIRPRCLQRGSLSPLGYLIECLQHGRAIARREGPSTNISWSHDYQLLHLGDQQIWMHEFRSTVHASLARAEQVTQELLLGWSPDVSLHEIRDDLVNTASGYSFLHHPANQLNYSFRVLKRRAFSTHGGFALRGRGRQKAISYLKQSDELVMLLFGGLHVTSGMPGRGEELRPIRWANTVAGPRNIFVHHVHIILVFSYSKADTNHNNSFFVVRSPAPRMERVLFLHLAYIRPFRDFLSRQLKLVSEPRSNPHVFTSYRERSSCFSAAQVSRSLQYSTQHCPLSLNLALYRQIAVSIAKKHIPDLLQPFDPHLPPDQHGLLRLMAFQTGHKPKTHAHHYALEDDFFCSAATSSY